MTYTFPAIGVWLCSFEFVGFSMSTTNGIAFGLSLNSTSMDAGWQLKQADTTEINTFSGTRIVSVTNLTTTLYCVVQVGTVPASIYPNVNYYTVQCVRIA